MTFVVVDVETTGGAPSSASLTEIAAARYQGGELMGTFRTFVRPDRRIPPFITALTGISDAMVADSPEAGTVLPALLEFVGHSVIVGHNVRFDLSFLDHALCCTGRRPLDNPTVDTLAMTRGLVRDDELANCRLETLADRFDLDHRPRHRALDDVLATGDLLHVLLELAGTFGIIDLGELLALPRLLRHPHARKLTASAALPSRPGVFWFRDARGHPLLVGRAPSIRRSARSYFLADGDRRSNRLLREMRSMGYRCLDEERSAEFESALLERWDPPFNRPAVSGRSRSRAGRSRRAGTRRKDVPQSTA